jgi:CheY-like chemotaxis protein
MIQTTLESLFPHMTFIHAESGGEAREYLHNYGKRVSLIISDFSMPEGNGDLVFEGWRKDFHYIPLIILSSEIEKAREAILKGKSNPYQRLSFLDKSETIDKLTDLCSYLLDQSFMAIPLNMIKEDTPLKYGLSLPLGDTKIIPYVHPGHSLEKRKLQEFRKKGANTFLVPFKDVSSELHHWPALGLHKEKCMSTPSLKDCFNEFRRLHLECLAGNLIKEEKLEKASHLLEREIDKFGESKVLKSLIEKDLTAKNYVLNHSLLTALISLMIITEADLNTHLNRKVLVKGCLFHDLFKNDSSAYDHDLNQERFDVVKVKKKLTASINPCQ